MDRRGRPARTRRLQRGGRVYLSTEGYSTHRHARHQDVQRWVEQGRIQRGADGYIDMAQADADLAAWYQSRPTPAPAGDDTPRITLDELIANGPPSRPEDEEGAPDAYRPRPVRVIVRRYKKQRRIRVRRDPDYRHAAPVIDEPGEDSAWSNQDDEFLRL